MSTERLFETTDGVIVERSTVGGKAIYYGKWMYAYPTELLREYMTDQQERAEDAVSAARKYRAAQRARSKR